MMTKHIPRIIIGRLPLYLRAFIRLQKDGHSYASSRELGQLLGISAAQIRKDLSHFGELGKRGKGYEIEFLISKLNQILNTDVIWDMIVIGAGDLGSGLARYKGFTDRGFKVSAIFDIDPVKIGKKIGDLIVKDIREMCDFVAENNIQIAVLAIPAEDAQHVIDDLVEVGITAILNYAPIYIKTPDGVQIEHIDPSVHLQKLSYFLK
ncbi:MAG TPA: redox-sensing transcriptional repressor Rex [Chloroflexi bacterium]|nr:MAG: redox-sensing transcriptional repressor Rex [Chloroflexota bacterium]HDN04529.1 redox-sensing transcriptional repressor Rex [Chloroflexota bacterium]